MSVIYNLTNLSQTNTTGQMLHEFNVLSENWLGISLILTTGIVIFMILKAKSDNKDALLGSSFIMTIESGTLWVIGVISADWAMYSLLLTVVMVIVVWMTD